VWVCVFGDSVCIPMCLVTSDVCGSGVCVGSIFVPGLVDYVGVI